MLLNPTSKEAAARLREAISSRRIIIVVANCHVNFEGRAKTSLGPGDRIILAKRDGSLLVHRPWGYEPVNYQPDRSTLSVKEVDGNTIITAQRRRPREVLEVICSKIYLLASMKMEDSAPFVHGSMEADLYMFVKRELEGYEKGLILHPPLLRPGGGIPDLVGVDAGGRRVVVEVKNEPADLAAVKQLHAYVREAGGGGFVRGILVAPSIRTSALRLSRELGLEFFRLDLRRYSMQRAVMRDVQERL